MNYKRIGRLLRDNWLVLVYMFILSVLLLIPAAIAPIFRQVFTDYILKGTAVEWLPTLLAVMFGMALFSAALMLLQNSTLLRLSNKIELTGESGYIWKLLRAPLKRFLSADSFALMERMNDAQGIASLLTGDLIRMLFSIINTVLYLFMMFKVDPMMALIVLALILLNYVSDKVQARVKKRRGARKAPPPEGADLHSLTLLDERVSASGLQNIETIKSMSSEQHFFQRLMGIKGATVMAKRPGEYTAAYSPLGSLPNIIFMNLLLLISAMRIMDREFTIGAYLAFSAYASAFWGPMNATLSVKKLLDGFEGRLKRLEETTNLEETYAPLPEETHEAVRKLDGNIAFDHVTFSYDGERNALTDFSLTLRPGQRIALVGRSGAGKSTVLKLLQGLYAPDAGTVTIDGQAVTAISSDVYTASVGSANQRISIFSGTVRHNITLWDEYFDDAAIYRAAEDACLHTFISSLSGGYDYMLDENGRKLSGGQRQRLEITRALLHSPTIVLLDESMSALDPITAARVDANLLRRGCTCIMATHAIANVHDFDEIIVLEEGRIVARGQHETLLATSPVYAELAKSEGGMAS